MLWSCLCHAGTQEWCQKLSGGPQAGTEAGVPSTAVVWVLAPLSSAALVQPPFPVCQWTRIAELAAALVLWAGKNDLLKSLSDYKILAKSLIVIQYKTVYFTKISIEKKWISSFWHFKFKAFKLDKTSLNIHLWMFNEHCMQVFGAGTVWICEKLPRLPTLHIFIFIFNFENSLFHTLRITKIGQSKKNLHQMRKVPQYFKFPLQVIGR